MAAHRRTRSPTNQSRNSSPVARNRTSSLSNPHVEPRSSTADRAVLSLYTYSNPVVSGSGPSTHLRGGETNLAPVFFQYASLPFPVRQGDYLELRHEKDGQRQRGYIFRVGEDTPHVSLGQIQVPTTIADAFNLQHRLDVTVKMIRKPEKVHADFIELQFSQYVGRADMWRLGMLLEGTSVHVGEKVSLAGGAVRATITSIFRRGHRYPSLIVTAKTKTIYRSKSAQTYLFIQLCQETWEFDEDGERFYEKVLHELFSLWKTTNASHLVTIILFARVNYDNDEVAYMEKHDLAAGLIKNCRGQWCKDFFRVVVDFERKADWTAALREIKQRIERSEREILLDFHLSQLRDTDHDFDEKRIIGKWSFAYEGNILETINLALNPFDEHYIDRDLSRTGLSMTVVTPGTGHFAVDKNLLRMTTERMIDHGIGLDLVCLTKMPLHAVPLFSYVSARPPPDQSAKSRVSTPDPLYMDVIDAALAFWVYCSFYSVTHDKPFRNDRFIPRCKMYEIQMLGILDHDLTTVIVPLMDTVDSGINSSRAEFDSALFGGDRAPQPDTESTSIPASYQSTRLLARQMEMDKLSTSRDSDPATLPPSPSPPRVPLPPLPPAQSPSSTASTDLPQSGASTPRHTPARRLRSQASKSSFASRFGASWLFGALSGRSQPSFPAAATETVTRHDVSTSSPSTPQAAKAIAVPGAVPDAGPVPMLLAPTQPVPITASRRPENDTRSVPQSVTRSLPRSISRSLQAAASIKLGRSLDDSYRNRMAAAYGRTNRHTTVNPCNPAIGEVNGQNRRWQHVKPVSSGKRQHVIKWDSLCAPACLPLTTDFMPTPDDIATYYEANAYDIACFSDQVSFLVRPDAAQSNLPLAVMREMASQRLSQNFQFIVLPHDTVISNASTAAHTLKVLLPGDSTSAGLRVGGASEVLKDASGAIYLSWSNHIHRLSFDPAKQSVTVQRFVRKIRHCTTPHTYKCLVWPYQSAGYQEAAATFKYPNVDARLNFNYLDRLIAGEEDQLTADLRYWRTRYLLIPSGIDPTKVSGLVPSGEDFKESDILITGAIKVLELLGRYQWRQADRALEPLKLLATTFDPSACVLDEGLMNELERMTSGQERITSGQQIEGLTLQAVADLMNKPNNGLIIYDRWWNCSCSALRRRLLTVNVHEDSFSGEQFCSWLAATFADIATHEDAVSWGRSLFEKGLIGMVTSPDRADRAEHVTGSHAFHDNYFFYRLRSQYDKRASQVKRSGHSKSWFGRKAAQTPRDMLEQHAAASSSDEKREPPLKLGPKVRRKRKVKMSQQIVIDLDPQKKSDRAEVAILHADIIHNARNAFHFELNWLGVTAGLLEEVRNKCSTLADRYGLRFVEAPVEQIKDISMKCAYRTPIHIPLAMAPPFISDLHLRIAENGSGHTEHYFEYAILCQQFGFVLDLEASNRYPDAIEVEYSYRGQSKFEYSQFVHKSGLALVQCLGQERGFLWSDNRPYITAPVRGRSEAAASNKLTKQEQAAELRAQLSVFCASKDKLQAFYQSITPPPIDKDA